MKSPVFLHPVTTCMMLASMVALLPPSAKADPPRSPAMKCIGGMLRSHRFTQRPPHSAEYNFTSLCESRDGRFYSVSINGTWTPTEGNPANANASEVYHISAAPGAEQEFDGMLGALCPGDPWLNKADCTRVGDNMSDELRTLWPDLVESWFPYSRSGILTSDRAQLLAEYNHANGIPDRAQLLTRHAGAIDAVAMHDAAKADDASGIHQPGEEVELNPQPLPPVETQAVPATTPVARNGAETAIIIVSGTPPQQRVDRTPRPTIRNAETLKRDGEVPASPSP